MQMLSLAKNVRVKFSVVLGSNSSVSPLFISAKNFHSSTPLFKDKGGMNTRSGGRTVSKKSNDKDDTPKKEKTDDEKAARKAEKAAREQLKKETRSSQLARSNDRKAKEDELKKKKEMAQTAALERVQGTFSHIFNKIDAPVAETITLAEEQEDEEINRILEKVESGELDDDDEVVVGGKKKTKKRALEDMAKDM